MFEHIESLDGDVWLIKNKKVILYISNEGNLHIKGNLITNSEIPKIPNPNLCK